MKGWATYVAIIDEDAENSAGSALNQDPATVGNQPRTWRIKVSR